MAGGRARHESRLAARAAWVKERIADHLAAQKRVQEAWDRIFDALPDHLDEDELEAMNIPDPPEQVEAEAIWAEIDAVLENDRWPRELHWSL